MNTVRFLVTTYLPSFHVTLLCTVLRTILRTILNSARSIMVGYILCTFHRTSILQSLYHYVTVPTVSPKKRVYSWRLSTVMTLPSTSSVHLPSYYYYYYGMCFLRQHLQKQTPSNIKRSANDLWNNHKNAV